MRPSSIASAIAATAAEQQVARNTAQERGRRQQLLAFAQALGADDERLLHQVIRLVGVGSQEAQVAPDRGLELLHQRGKLRLL